MSAALSGTAAEASRAKGSDARLDLDARSRHGQRGVRGQVQKHERGKGSEDKGKGKGGRGSGGC